ncbi:MAG: hypothetical protein MHPSP_001734, partial [Paramarteilia canceri]
PTTIMESVKRIKTSDELLDLVKSTDEDIKNTWISDFKNLQLEISEIQYSISKDDLIFNNKSKLISGSFDSVIKRMSESEYKQHITEADQKTISKTLTKLLAYMTPFDKVKDLKLFEFLLLTAAGIREPYSSDSVKVLREIIHKFSKNFKIDMDSKLESFLSKFLVIVALVFNQNDLIEG